MEAIEPSNSSIVIPSYGQDIGLDANFMAFSRISSFSNDKLDFSLLMCYGHHSLLFLKIRKESSCMPSNDSTLHLTTLASNYPRLKCHDRLVYASFLSHTPKIFITFPTSQLHESYSKFTPPACASHSSGCQILVLYVSATSKTPMRYPTLC